MTTNDGIWLLALDWVIRIGALFWIPSHTRPAAARSWLLLVGFVPLLGLPVYLLLGHPWLSDRRRSRQAAASRLIVAKQVPLAQLRWTPADAAHATDVSRLVERMGDFMPTVGNAVALLDDYAGSLQSLLDDIDAAQADVHLLYYLLFADDVGAAIDAALRRAAARGVRCRVLLDAMGARPGVRAYAKGWRTAGIELHALLPRSLPWRRNARMDLRNHRKIAVIDGRVGYVGSQNLAASGFVRDHPNHEVVARVEGPAAGQLAALFASDWYIETGEVLEIDVTRAAPMRSGGPAQVLPSGPAYPFENARNAIVALVQCARTRVVLATPYFVPDEAVLGALSVAALSGVEVQLVLSRPNNQRLTAWAQAAYYDELLAAGVRIALYRPGFLHAKHLSVDDRIALVGSINLDIRSFALNAEVGLLSYDPAVVARLHEIERGYLADADAVDAATWARRPALRRSVEGIARLADSFL